MGLKDQFGIRWLLAGISLTFLFTDCIRGDSGVCPERTAIYIVVDPGKYGGNYIPVEAAAVYLFDRNGFFVSAGEATTEQIAGDVPVMIPAEHSNGRVVVWGNVKDREQITRLTAGTPIGEALLTLKDDAQGYAMTPDDLFHGAVRLSGRPAGEVVVSPKTARLNITVKGLSPSRGSEDYYFTVESDYKGYDFTGAPLSGGIEHIVYGVFDSEGDYATAAPSNIIHYPAVDAGGPVNGVVVNLWATDGENGDALIASVGGDAWDIPLRPQAGTTVNILIRLSDGGQLQAEIVITPWDELHQWTEW